MGAPQLSTLELHQLLREQCGGNPLNGEWADLYPAICDGIAWIGPHLAPHRELHQLPVAAAAIHYVRESFQSEGNFWDGFMLDVGLDNRNLLFDTIYHWMIRSGITVLSGDGQRREVVKTLLSITGVPAHWNRDFAEFFIWYFRNNENGNATAAWPKYPLAGRMAGRESSFIPAADKLNRVFQHLLEEGVDPEANPAEVCDEVSERLGPEFDPRRLVRRQDSFVRLWRHLFERLTPGQFRRWLRGRPSAWVTTPEHEVEAARQILMADDIQFGTYVCDHEPIDVVPHPKVSLRSVVQEWPEDVPWFGRPGHVGFRSSHSFEFRRDGELYAASRPFAFEGVRAHVALMPIPLGGHLELPSGNIPGLTGFDWPVHDLWLQRQADQSSLYLVVPRTLVASPDEANSDMRLEVLWGETVLEQRVLRLNGQGLAKLYDWRVPLPNPSPGEVVSRLMVAGEYKERRSTALPPVMLFSPSGDLVRPRRRAAAFGERRYTLLLAQGELLPAFDPDVLDVNWVDAGCGGYRIAQVRWKRGRFQLSACGCTWEFERGQVTDLWVTCHPPEPKPNQHIQLELPSNAVDSLHQLEVRLITSGAVEAGQLTLHIFRDNVPMDSLIVRPRDVLSTGHASSDRTVWKFTPEWLSYLDSTMREPGMYDLAMATSSSIVSRFRVYLAPAVRMQTTLPTGSENTRVSIRLLANGPVFLHRDGKVVPEMEVPVSYRTHEVPNATTGVRCYPEPCDTVVMFARPQLTATLKAAPVVAGIRPLTRQNGTWEKEPRPDFQELRYGGIYVFGCPGVRAELTTEDGTRIAGIRLDGEGQGLFEHLNALTPYCPKLITTFQVRAGGMEFPYVVSRSPRYRNLLYDSAVSPDGTFSYSVEVTGPTGTQVTLLLSAPGQEFSLHESELDGGAGWTNLRGSLAGHALVKAAQWRLLLVLGGKRHLLGKLWSLGLATGGIGDRTGLLASDLPRRAAQAAADWAAGAGESVLLVWVPVDELREACVERIHTTCPGVTIYTPEDAGGGDPITEQLLVPGGSFLSQGVGLPEGLPPKEALRQLAKVPLAPILVPEAHLLSAFESSVLRQLQRRILLVAAAPMRL